MTTDPPRFRVLGAVNFSDNSDYVMLHECTHCYALVATSGIDGHEATHADDDLPPPPPPRMSW